MTRNLAILVVLLALPVSASSGKKGAAVQESMPIVKYRHQLMEGMGKHMKAAAMIVKGEVDRPADMVLHAAALHGASKAIPELFPKGTGPDMVKSDSKAAVWTDWDGFLAKNKAFEDASAKLLEVATAGDLAGFKAQFGEVGKSCGGCHDDFRVDDD